MICCAISLARSFSVHLYIFYSLFINLLFVSDVDLVSRLEFSSVFTVGFKSLFSVSFSISLSVSVSESDHCVVSLVFPPFSSVSLVLIVNVVGWEG